MKEDLTTKPPKPTRFKPKRVLLDKAISWAEEIGKGDWEDKVALFCALDAFAMATPETQKALKKKWGEMASDILGGIVQ